VDGTQKIANVENSKLPQLTQTLVVWLQQAKNYIDLNKVQNSLHDIFSSD
jgi:hypothetical protein